MKEKFKMLSTSMLVMLMVFLIPQMVFASTEIPTQTSEFYINDFADVLTDEEEKIMLHNAEALEDEYEGTQIVVTTVPNTGDMEADDYSFEMYDKYKIGKDSMGILILFSNGEGTDHRSIYVATGKGMEAYITDSRAGKFIDKYAMPYFEKEEYSDGLIALQTELIKEVKLQLANENGGNAKNTSNLSTEFIVEVLIIIGGIAVILAIIFLVINKIKKRKAKIDFLERKIERLTENSRNADIFFEQEREALNRKIFMLQEKLDKESTKCNYMNEQLEKLQDRYQRAEKLYPGLDEAISNMIEQEFVARCKSEASEVEQQIEVALKEDVIVKYMGSTEAEAVKLFANTYLALRVSYFNELDTYAELKGLNTKDIVEGVCLDPRIGDYYNNPSFGYGGYCLPKDTKQLLANYDNVPQNLIEAIVKSNKTRKEHIINMILKKHPKTVGIYRLTMKANSDNFRASAISDIIKGLMKNNIEILIYEPTLDKPTYSDCAVVKDFDEFKNNTDVILVNRIDDNVRELKNKVYTRDLYEKD